MHSTSKHFQALPGTSVSNPTLPAPSSRSSKTVLLVAEEPFVRELMATQLRAAGCFPMAVASLEEGQRLAAQMVPDLIVVDLDASPAHEAGWTLRLARETTGKMVRTAMLSSDVSQACGSGGSRCGAQLCVPKPFEPRVLMRQLLKLLRPLKAEGQRPPRARPPMKAASIELDRQQPTVRLQLPTGWRTLDLPWTEHRLLAHLLKDAERARSREEIRDAVWSDAPVDLRTVDQYVRRLRRTLEAIGARDLVKTINGVGYRLDLEALKRSAGGAGVGC